MGMARARRTDMSAWSAIDHQRRAQRHDTASIAPGLKSCMAADRHLGDFR